MVPRDIVPKKFHIMLLKYSMDLESLSHTNLSRLGQAPQTLPTPLNNSHIVVLGCLIDPS